MGQMVGNRFVPTPWTMGLANAVGDIVSALENRKADDEEKQLATGRVDRSRKALSDQLDALRPPTDENNPRFAPYDINAPDPKSPFQAGRDFTLEGPKLDFNAALREQQNVVPKVNVVGQAGSAPEFTDPIKAKRLQMMIEALDSGMAPEQIAQLNLQQQLGDLAPVKLGLGETYGIPGQAPMATNPKPVTPRDLKTEKVAKKDASGNIVYDKNGDVVMELRTFDPAAGTLGESPLGEVIGNSGTKVTQQVGFPKETFKNEKDLRAEHTDASKSFVKLRDAYNTVNASLSGPITAPATLAGATKFMKMLDPDSVVRESELSMALKSTGLMDRFLNLHNVVMKGQVLTPSQVAEIQRIAGALYQTAEQQQGKLDAQYEGLAKQYGLDPGRVVMRQRAITAPPSKGDAKGWSVLE